MKMPIEDFRAQVDSIILQLQRGARDVGHEGRLGQAGLLLAAAQALEVLWWKAFPAPVPDEAPAGDDKT